MKEFETLLKLTENNTVELASSFKNLINKELMLGQSRYLCRYGTLSDGHEKITQAQRYYQSIKEMYYLASNIRSQKSLAMIAQADILDAENELTLSIENNNKSGELRARGKLLQSQERLIGCLVTIEDQMRMIDEYNRVRLELQDEVRSKYPEGIEQAEEDNWNAVAKYRAVKRAMGIQEQMTNLPFDKVAKARLGEELGTPDLCAWEMADSSTSVRQIFSRNDPALISRR